MSTLTFERPFPALTAAQRYYLDTFGYVVIQDALALEDVEKLKESLYRLRYELTQQPNPSSTGPGGHGAYLLKSKPYHHFMANIVEFDPIVTAYATHPLLVSMAEELIGGEARIVEMNAHINSRIPHEDLNASSPYGFHRGTDIPFGTHTKNGLFHCNFVKTLTNLTDLGPDDGGTVVIAGSHKIDAPTEDIIAAAYQDRSLIHQVIAPAGSTLLFSETLIHATGHICSDNERVIIITGYGSTLFPYWDKGTLSNTFRKEIPPQLKTLFHGKSHWTRGPRYRRLNTPTDNREFPMGKWNQRPVLEEKKQPQ